MGLAGKLNWLLAGDPGALLKELWIQTWCSHGFLPSNVWLFWWGKQGFKPQQFFLNGASWSHVRGYLMHFLSYLQVHQRIQQTLANLLFDLHLRWGTYRKHRDRWSSSLGTGATARPGIWVSWCCHFVAGYFGFCIKVCTLQLLLGGGVGLGTVDSCRFCRCCCVQMRSMPVRFFSWFRYERWSDEPGLKINEHHKWWSLSWIKLVAAARVCCGFSAPSSLRTMWFWYGPWSLRFWWQSSSGSVSSALWFVRSLAHLFVRECLCLFIVRSCSFWAFWCCYLFLFILLLLLLYFLFATEVTVVVAGLAFVIAVILFGSSRHDHRHIPFPSFERQHQGEAPYDEGALFHLCQLHAGQIPPLQGFHLSQGASWDLDQMCSFPHLSTLWTLLLMGPKTYRSWRWDQWNVSADRLTAWEIPDTWRIPTARLGVVVRNFRAGSFVQWRE